MNKVIVEINEDEIPYGTNGFGLLANLLKEAGADPSKEIRFFRDPSNFKVYGIGVKNGTN